MAGLLLGAAEGLARGVRIPDGAPPPPGDGVLLHGNPWLLWELVPGEHEEKGVSVRVNAAGFRDRERGPKTGERWMALGDSSIYGFGVEDEEVFTARLEAERGVEVINAGVPGYSSFQVLNQLRMRGLALRPDVLVIGSIWSDNNFDSFVDRELLASYAGWEASPTARLRGLLEASALFRWLDWELRVGPQAARAKKVGWQVGDIDPKIGLRRVEINDYAANLAALCRLADRAIFLLLPNREDLSPGPGGRAWNAYRDVLRDSAARCGAPVVDLPKIFSASGESADALFLDQMHPTALGHALIATALRTLQPGAARDPGPSRLWTDPQDGRRPAGPSLDGELILPQFRGGRVLLDLVVDGRIVAGGSQAGPGPVHLRLPGELARATLRVTIDAAQDGGEGDPAWELDIDPRRAHLDFSAARPAR